MPIALRALAWGGRVAAGRVMDGLGSGAADTTASWQLKVFAVVYVVFSLPIVLHLLTHPALLLRRLRAGPIAEPEPSQKLIVSLVLLCVAALFAISVLDSKRGWSHVPVPLVALGDVLVAAGLVLIWLVFRANEFAAAAVHVDPEQTVISNGPYARVRHPLYSGALLLVLGAPLGLGSWWGLAIFPPILALIIWRLTDEERYLSAHLPGYRDYCARVKYRLIPSIW